MYAIQDIEAGEFVCGTDFDYGPDSCRQRTSSKQMLNFESLRQTKLEFLRLRCGNDYRIVRVKTPEVERVIGFDTPDGYDCDIWEETPNN